ncbi:MAG: alpha/beta hydrolase [Clostridia bacterium]
MKFKKAWKISLFVILGLVVMLTGLFLLYVSDYSRADQVALDVLASGQVESFNQGEYLVFAAKEGGVASKDGLIFYPGGKVEYSAYAPLLQQLAEQGITSVLVKMPFNLAVFGIDKGAKALELAPEVKNWYIGGHSLGGVMASSFAEKQQNALSGMIFLGAYSISKASLPILEIYGSEDKGLDKTKLAKVSTKIEILGGNHAFFGNYGTQKGDGTATITRAEQQKITVEGIANFIKDTSAKKMK